MKQEASHGKKIPRQRFTKEFREQAARLVVHDGLLMSAAAKQLGISAKTLGNWVRKARQGGLSGVGSNRKPVTELEAEVAKLHRELAISRMECDLIKKAAAYFARASLPSMRS